MPVQFDKFDQQKVDNIKNHLESVASKGKARNYEIFVDGLKAVNKTDDVAEFYNYETYLTANTNDIKFVLYGAGTSPRNDQYVFSMKAKDAQEALELGLDGVTSRSYSKRQLEDFRKERNKKNSDAEEIAHLRGEIDALNKELEDKEEYIEIMEQGIEKAKANGNKIGDMHIGDIVSVALEGLVRRNTHIIKQVPGLDGVAELIERDSKQLPSSAKSEEAEVSFKKKNVQPEPTAELTEQEKQFLELFKEIQKHFSENEMGQVIEILENLSKDKTQIQPVLELIQAADPE